MDSITATLFDSSTVTNDSSPGICCSYMNSSRESNTVTTAAISTICVISVVIGAPVSLLIVISIISFRELCTYYNALVASLAVRDFVFLGCVVPIFMTGFLLGEYPFGPVVCKFQLMVTFPFGLGTVLELMNIAISRFVKLCCHPSTYSMIYNKRGTCCLLALSWGLSCLMGMPPALLDGFLDSDIHQCYIKKSTMKATVTTLTIIAATAVTMFCYINILRKILLAKMNLRQYNEGPAKQRKVSMTIRRSCRDFSVFTIYIFFLLPFVVVNGFGLQETPDLAWDLAKLCSFLNNFSNSIIYGLFNSQLRHCICSILRLRAIRRMFCTQNTVHPFYLSDRSPQPRTEPQSTRK